MVVGIGDVCAAAATLYVLLPAGSTIGFTTFVGVYVLAAMNSRIITGATRANSTADTPDRSLTNRRQRRIARINSPDIFPARMAPHETRPSTGSSARYSAGVAR